jgi:hypothetical protein
MDLENSAQEAPRRGSAYNPTGFRRLTPGLLQVDRTAESFAGLPDGVTAGGQLLAAFKAAAPRLGLSTRLTRISQRGRCIGALDLRKSCCGNGLSRRQGNPDADRV